MSTAASGLMRRIKQPMLENSYCMDAFLEALDAPMKDEALQNKRVMNENRIKTKHPEGKSGVSISKEKYDAMRAAILDCLDEKGEMTYTELTKDINEKLKDKFKGSINWYVECVKLDLEARKIIERIPKTRPALYRQIKR